MTTAHASVITHVSLLVDNLKPYRYILYLFTKPHFIIYFHVQACISLMFATLTQVYIETFAVYTL